jgi:hypothetical protein
MLNSQKRLEMVYAFNTTFESFLSHIQTLYPSNNELKKGAKAILSIKRVNITYIIRVWYLEIYDKFKQEIDNTDILFFENNFSNMQCGDEIESILHHIRDTIHLLSEDDKSIIMNNIYNLSKLSELYTLVK